ncbi:Sel1-repeat containing protein [Chondrus crispus]|uniref:Sel1-repeat containing protein n=1 Tax=Chondrus crispus TaxID=2769 RepID=R7QGX1_CHOCR|nr:Sel1-repeat containing protein [Chondrus crispus]CDF36670.1 Sel1-repeat containing protein [Chondrus crispus]|eukprot:XP_005716489.1 Sel1-repeat containing protein [Chondrus crispus]
MFNLAVVLRDGGDGVAQNSARAVELYEYLIEELDDIQAMVHLGFLLLKEGAERLERSVVRAFELFGRAIWEGRSGGTTCQLVFLMICSFSFAIACFSLLLQCMC